jgi:hypothetical protein
LAAKMNFEIGFKGWRGIRGRRHERRRGTHECVRHGYL